MSYRSMILTCPSCSAKFLVPDSAFAKGARSVRCGKCAHHWTASPPNELASIDTEDRPTIAAKSEIASDKTSSLENSAKLHDNVLHDSDSLLSKEPRFSAKRQNAKADDDIYDRSQLPALIHSIDVGPTLVVTTSLLTILVIGLGLLVAAPAWQTIGWMKPFYRLIGMTDSRGLQIANLEYQRIETGIGTRYRIGCDIYNGSEQTRQTPHMKIQLLGKDGRVLMQENDLMPEQKSIAAAASIPCNIPSPPLRFASAETLVLDIGAPLAVSQRHSSQHLSSPPQPH